MSTESEELKERTRTFALDVLRLFHLLPRDEASRYLGRQVMRSANSIAANYRAACRARSRQEFVSRLGLVAGEADETAHWFDMLVACRIAVPMLPERCREAHELAAIFSKS